MPQPRTILVAGSQGVIDQAAGIHWAQQAGTTVFGLSRRNVPEPEGVHHAAVDLLNPADVRSTVEGLSNVTHLIFAAYIHRDRPAELIGPNVAMLRNCSMCSGLSRTRSLPY